MHDELTTLFACRYVGRIQLKCQRSAFQLLFAHFDRNNLWATIKTYTFLMTFQEQQLCASVCSIRIRQKLWCDNYNIYLFLGLEFTNTSGSQSAWEASSALTLPLTLRPLVCPQHLGIFYWANQWQNIHSSVTRVHRRLQLWWWYIIGRANATLLKSVYGCTAGIKDEIPPMPAMAVTLS